MVAAEWTGMLMCTSFYDLVSLYMSLRLIYVNNYIIWRWSYRGYDSSCW